MTSFLLVSLLLFTCWLVAFLLSDETRFEQMVMSIVGLVLAPGVLIVAAADYRAIISETASPVGLEDLLFAFSFVGLAAVIYQLLVGKHAHKIRGERFELHHAGHWVAHLLLIFGLWAVIALVLIDVFDLLSVRAIIISGLLIGMYIVVDRRDLLMNALLSGLFMAGLLFILEAVFFVRLFPADPDLYWRLEQLSPFLIGGVPLEEILWAAVAGFAIGPLYEWLRHYKLTSGS